MELTTAPAELETALVGTPVELTRIREEARSTEKPTPERIVVEIDKNGRDALRVTLSSYKGTETISIWEWYRASSGDLKPGKRGLSVGVRHLPALAAALQSALSIAREEGRISAH